MDSQISRRKRQAFTLVEVVIAIAILAMICVSVIASIIYSAKETQINTNAITAKNVAQGYFERMAVDTFSNVNPPPSGVYADVDYDEFARCPGRGCESHAAVGN